MKTIINYLDDLKEKLGSDYRTAKIINVNVATISTIRKRQLMSDETAVKVADALGIGEYEVLIAAAIARSQGDVKNAWTQLAERITPGLEHPNNIHCAK